MSSASDSTSPPFFLPDLSHPSYLEAVRNQLEKGDIGPGEAVEALAEAIKDYTGANHVVLTTSGTVALQLALLLAIGGNGRKIVGVPAYGEIATANAVTWLGHWVYPLEIDMRTGCLSPRAVKDALSFGAELDAIVFVNFSGSTPGDDIREIMGICQEHGIAFIEDAACALGHSSEYQHAGTFGKYGTLSFSPHKLVTTGQGGALLLRDEENAEFIRAAIAQGGKGEVAGSNYRMSDIQAALGLAQMRRIQEIHEQRWHQWEELNHWLNIDNDTICQPLWTPGEGPPLHNITFEDLEGRKNYKLLSDHPYYARTGDFMRRCPNAQRWAEEARYLPFGLGQK